MNEKVHEDLESFDTLNSNPSSQDDGENLSEDDLQKLRRIPAKIPWTVYSVTMLEMAEHLSLTGTLVVSTNFIQFPLPPGSSTGAGHQTQSGALGRGQQVASAVSMAKSLWIGAAPLLGAFVADQYLGRYRTLQWANVVTIVAHLVLVVAAAPQIITHASLSLTLYILGVMLLGLGFGGIKPNIAALLLEQLPDTRRSSIDKKGRHVLIDPEVTRSQVTLYFFCFVNIGSIAGMVSMVYCEKYVGFWLAFTVPTLVFLLCPLILWAFRGAYTATIPKRGVCGKVVRLCILSMTRRWSWNIIKMYRSTQESDFWTRVKPSNMTKQPNWMTFDDSWVDEVSRPAVRQIGSNLTSQAATLNLFGLPNDALVNFNSIFCVLLALFHALVLNPSIERFGIRPSHTTRIGLGFFSGAVGMAISAVNQHYIYKHSLCGSHANECISNTADNKLSVFIQIPVYFFIANSEVLAIPSGIEYAYKNSPKNLGSIVMALFYFTIVIGSGVAQALVTLTKDPLLIWNYVAAGCLCWVAAIGVWKARR
ncbi:Nn.00g052620.m01.CDS01 [Neocucurbitaria sp. VM-36]